MTKERVYFIYKYTFPNGKVYIGQTYKGSYRFNNPEKYKGQLVWNAMNKYKTYDKKILEYCNKDNVDERERYYISLYDSMNPSKGYNREIGGSENKQFSKEAIDKLSKSHINLQTTSIKQYSLSGKYIKKWKSIKEASNTLGIERSGISKAIHGIIKSAGGFVWKSSEKYSPYSHKEVSQYDLHGNHIKDWKNIKEVEKILEINNLLQAILGKYKTKKGFQWRFKDSDKTIKNYSFKSRRNTIKDLIATKKYNGKRIYQYSLDGKLIKKWNSYIEASRKLNISEQQIYRVLKGERKKTHNFIFSYTYSPNGIKPYNSNDNESYKSVLQYNVNGKFIREWKNISTAAKSLNIDDGGIGRCCNNKQRQCAGYIWRFKNENDIIENKNTPILQYSKEGIFIKEWDSIDSICKCYSILPQAIEVACKKSNCTSVGFQWKFKNQKKKIQPIVKKPAKGRKVNQYDKDGNFIKTFISASAASRAVGLKGSTQVILCCQHKKKSAGGFKWKYNDE